MRSRSCSPVPAGVVQISNTATIADDGANGTDPTPANNTASDTDSAERRSPTFTISKSDGGATATPGDGITYTLSYRNAGNQGATGVVLTDAVPANTTFNAGGSTAGWACAPNNNAGSSCTLAVGALAAAARRHRDLRRHGRAARCAAGVVQISNTATIADDGANGTDPDAGQQHGQRHRHR